VPYSRLLLNPTVIANAITEFGAYWGLSLLIAWFTPYLIAGLGLSASTAHVISVVPWAVNAAFIVGLSWYSQRLMTRGVSSRLARGVLGAGCVVVGGIALAAMPYVDALWVKILIVTIGISIPSVVYVLGPAILSEITPASQRGAILSINNATVTLAGLLGPYLTGSAIQDTATQSEGYVHGFFICGVITLVSRLVGMVFIRPEAEIRRFEAAARRDAAQASAVLTTQ
jgi:MFS transporter, ACS family, D-galactonate transporter